jgi:membrane fusion protein (multidrug efflux system)
MLRRDHGGAGEIDQPYDTGTGRALLRRTLLLAGPLVLIAVAGVWWLTGGRYVSTDDAYVQSDTTSVATDVSGTVSEVDVTDNQPVKAGQILFRIDDASFRIALDRANAQLAVARTNVEALKAQYNERQQEIHLAEVNGDFASREFNRASSLYSSRVVSQDQLDRTRHDLDASRQQLLAAQQQLAMIGAQLGGDSSLPTDQYPQVQEAKAVVAEAQRELNNTIVRASADGIVSNVPNIRPGSYLPAGTSAFALVSTDHSWIEADFKETDLTWVRDGQQVDIEIDTYPGVSWTGRVASQSPASGAEFSVLPAQNSSGNWVKVVQRIPVRIAVDAGADQPPLRAGMSADITIDTQHRRHLPNFLSFLGL